MALHRTARRVTAAGTGLILALTLSLNVGSASASPGAHRANGGPGANSDSSTPTGVDHTSAIVRFSGDPVSTDPRTAPRNGHSLNLRSSAVRNVRADLAQQRNAFQRWLRANAPQAKVTGQYDIALNAVAVRLNGTSLDTLRSAPGVASVGYESLYTPLADTDAAPPDDPDLALIDAKAGWAAARPGDAEHAGWGVKVGVIDTGIDVTHPCFDDADFPATQQLGDTRFTNNKVIVAKVFNNKAVSRGYTAEAIQDHGTHVSGTIACDANTPAVVNGADIPYDPSGVAPGAQLGNYNIFPGDVTDARSEDILNAMEAAVADGMTVLNLSLGGDASGNQDLLTTAIDNLDRANIVVAVAAGNSGPGRFTVESPGSAERALTAGASSVGQFVGTPILSGGETVSVAAIGDFPTPDSDLTATLQAAPDSTDSTLANGCDPYGDVNMDGEIALIQRGACSFSQKVFNAEQAGAVAAIVVNNLPGDPIAMGLDGVFTTTIPAVQSGNADLATLLALSGSTVTIGATAQYTYTGNNNIMADFSSQGPTDVDFRIKPDVVAPGVNVLSSVPHTACDDPGTLGCWAFFQGTSMATPHLAGMAAVIRQAHPEWAAWQVRSAIVNTAQQGVLFNSTAITQPETSVQVTGSGLADLNAALHSSVTLSAVSTSFGAVPARSGKPLARTVSVTNVSGGALTLPLQLSGSSAFAVSPATLSLAPGGSGTVTIRFSPAAGAAGENQATLDLGGVAHSELFAFVK
jgi:subtilisin family serine protease